MRNRRRETSVERAATGVRNGRGTRRRQKTAGRAGSNTFRPHYHDSGFFTKFTFNRTCKRFLFRRQPSRSRTIILRVPTRFCSIVFFFLTFFLYSPLAYSSRMRKVVYSIAVISPFFFFFSLSLFISIVTVIIPIIIAV